MCNDYKNHVPYDEIARAFSDRRIRIFGDGRPNLAPRDEIWPSDIAGAGRGRWRRRADAKRRRARTARPRPSRY